MALAAYARVLTLAGQFQSARDRLENALAAEPRFVDAYLDLARLYLTERNRWANDWASRVESLLKQVLKLRPTCRQAALLLATLYCDPAVDRVDDAEASLRRIPDDGEACLRLATILSERDVAHPCLVEPLQCLRRYVAFSGRFDEKASELVARCLSKETAAPPQETWAWRALRSALLQLRTEPATLEAQRIATAVQRIDLRASARAWNEQHRLSVS